MRSQAFSAGWPQVAESRPDMLPWHESVWSGLRERIVDGRLHHALLISGPQGIGKRRLAQLVTRALVCTSDGVLPCGSCRSCQLMCAGSHPDSLQVVPEEPGRQIRIAQVREELIEFVARTPSIAPRKAVLIDPAEAMNTATANCLLKSLEEPAAGTFLVLVSDAPVRLLPTVRSRCEQLRLQPPPWQEAMAWLVGRTGAEGAEDLLGAASGCPLRAADLAQAGGLEQFDRVAALMQRARDPGAWVSTLAGGRESDDLRALLAWMQIFLTDLGRWLADPRAIRLRRARPHYEALAVSTDAAHVARTLRRVTEAAREAASTANPNRQLMLESLLIAWGRQLRA